MSAFKYLSLVQLAESMNFMYISRAVAKRRTSALLAFLDFQRSERTPVVGLIARHTEQILLQHVLVDPATHLAAAHLLALAPANDAERVWLRLKPCLLPLLCMRELIVPEMGVHLPSWPPVGFVLALFLRGF